MCDATDREQVFGQILSVVDPSVHGHKALQAGFVFHVGVVEARVEHDDGKRQDVAGVCPTHTHTQEAGNHSQLCIVSSASALSIAAIKNNDCLPELTKRGKSRLLNNLSADSREGGAAGSSCSS